MLDRGYVVVPIPNNCYGCWLSYEDDRRGIFCTMNDEDVSNYAFNKPERCPIREFPGEQYLEDECDIWERGYCRGYNVCLDDVKGE